MVSLSGPQIYKAKERINTVKSITLSNKTGQTTQTTLLPIYHTDLEKLPRSLLEYLHGQFNKEIVKGDTYPHLDELSYDEFLDAWFSVFHSLLIGQITDDDEQHTVDELFSLLKKKEQKFLVENGADSEAKGYWDHVWFGSYYIKPNYIGRSSHICNAGFLVNPARRGNAIGKALGETYLEWAPKLGYVYSVFNLVYETNTASVKIWDSLGFERIGRVPGAGVLKGHGEKEGKRVDAIVFGRDLV